jgi:hypothetical protein
LSLQELADLIQVSPSYFGQLFKQTMGKTPHQYLIQCRIERAQELLRKPVFTIAEVAHRMHDSVSCLDDCQYLLVSQINYTLTNFADHCERLSHDQINRCTLIKTS